MSDVLSLCRLLPELQVAAGHVLIEEGVPMGRVYVLKEGAFEVVRSGVRVVAVTQPGSFMGEISAVLGSAPMADVVAVRDSTVYIVDDAQEAARRDPALTYAIAQLLARRLQAVTSYLVDIKRQYAGTNTHLELMDQVLANLMAMQQGASSGSGSERTDVPDY
ncbi:cyclic nucleotide-binding domain-containing protein [Caenimonas koreensis DSM 17982]|uniref:Cyclic nucleotide-binding domain-containing protein n=1 Tax=Caenimonas koreensis DSM 17982 TaxID=1121255 RepID=A0A844B4T8_9BURK|nr:Crp/Fnr family transcriptional regulator [Caenimonas koreensis]MRD48232.1 cyclic nucleotide-binding domain-containing protein [Caenimonas koreensis DSM 17982]